MDLKRRTNAGKLPAKGHIERMGASARQGVPPRSSRLGKREENAHDGAPEEDLREVGRHGADREVLTERPDRADRREQEVEDDDRNGDEEPVDPASVAAAR